MRAHIYIFSTIRLFPDDMICYININGSNYFWKCPYGMSHIRVYRAINRDRQLEPLPAKLWPIGDLTNRRSDQKNTVFWSSHNWSFIKDNLTSSELQKDSLGKLGVYGGIGGAQAVFAVLVSITLVTVDRIILSIRTNHRHWFFEKFNALLRICT